jgi:hypothetical protein
MEEVHNTSKLSKPSTQAREVEQQHPGAEQAPKDKRLENEPQIVQDVFPALPRCSDDIPAKGAWSAT